MKKSLSVCAFSLMAVMHVGAAIADRPWLSEDERKFMVRTEYGIEAQKGTPEGDAKRFYTNKEKTEFIEINYDESKAGDGEYTIEDPLVFADGSKVKNAADWTRRRQEILKLFEREMYGRLPPKPEVMPFELLKDELTQDRFARRRTYRQWFRADKSGPHVDWLVLIPVHAEGKVPVFLHLNYKGNDLIASGRTNHYVLPWEMLIANGYAFMSACYQDITADRIPPKETEDHKAFDGVHELWGYRDPKCSDNTGALMTWAWGLMRGLDLAEALPEIDASRNVVIGSSRLGKAALLAGAYDDRFKVVIPNQTGAGGVQLMKREYGENAKAQRLMFPHWYCSAYWKYENDPRSQQFDQHLLLACVAPRNLLLECYHKKWFDPRGEFLAAKAAAPVWKFLNVDTFESDRLPAAYDESFLKPPFGYVTRTECHGLSPYDWKWALEFANRAFAKKAPSFVKAEPVWPEGLEREKNSSIRFAAAVKIEDTADAILRITGSSAYRIRMNGKFVGYGPARGPIGWFRVDEWPLVSAAKSGMNELEIEVSGYNIANFYLPNQPAFLQAEVVCNGKVIAATSSAADGAFKAKRTDRIRKTARYSYQRTFSEAYRVGSCTTNGMLMLSRMPEVKLLERIAPYPKFELNNDCKVISAAKVAYDPAKMVEPIRFIDVDPNDKIHWPHVFPKAELEVNGWEDGSKLVFTDRKSQEDAKSVKLQAGESVIVDAGVNDCGFTRMKVAVTKPGKLMLTFDEILSDGEVDMRRLHCCNVVEWFFERPGTYEVETFEPYVWRYANLLTLDGEFTVSDFAIRTYKNPEAGRATFKSSDAALEKVFAAAKETFVQNAVDVFTDCPSRERAGWLCDSFFIGRMNAVFCGNAELERLFLQNYALPKSFECLPEGMVAMCYPSDHRRGSFIPNWSMWMVMEAEEYLRRSGDRATIDALKPRFLALVKYLKTFYNSDGLLERLPSWVFVEWSQSNKLVQDVNYPSNMTWAEVLDVINRLYDMPELADEAAKIRETVRRQSWTGEWFCDNAVRQKDGTLKLSGECTETCQYYAFFFRTATPETHPELWKKLVDDFGPQREKTGKHAKIWPSNAFIGNYLRLECLSREGLHAQILEETKGFFLYMAERTGTLWEFVATTASCNHGFASHAAMYLYRDVLGVKELDLVNRTVRIDPDASLPMQWCEGDMPVSPTEVIKVRWEKTSDGSKPIVTAALPAGWTRL